MLRLAENGYREVTLLGQNVNSYFDRTDDDNSSSATKSETAKDSATCTHSRDGSGHRFADLLEAVAEIDPEMRVRFTSPHPKDFSDDVLEVISKYPNIVRGLHLPAQSGSSEMLKRMRRGHTREVYLSLVRNIKNTLGPQTQLSTDMIAGFCGETEEEHRDTIRLMEEVGYEQAFMFAYSLRERTHAAHRMEDDVVQRSRVEGSQKSFKPFEVPDSTRVKGTMLVQYNWSSLRVRVERVRMVPSSFKAETMV